MSIRVSPPAALALALCLATVLPPVSARAQSPALDELKAKYQEEVNAAERDLKEKYITALERIQQQLQSRAQLEDALAVKREREKIEAELAASGSGTTSPTEPHSPSPSGASEFVFKPATATPLGAVEFVERWEALTGWRNQGSGAEWDLASVPKGVYSVIIEYGGPIDGGTLKAEQEEAVFEFAVPSTGGWGTYSTLQAGQINIADPSAPLRIVVQNDGGSPVGFLILRSVTLKRLGG